MCHNKTTENTLKSHIFIKVNEEAFRINPKLVLLTLQRNGRFESRSIQIYRKANVENDIYPIFPWIVYKFSISITGFLGVFWPPKIV